MRLAVVALAGVVLAGGAALSHAEDLEIATLRQRVAEYWDARANRDFCRQRNLSHPRPTILRGPEMLVWEHGSCPDYGSGKGAIQYVGYEVGDAKIDGSVATVNVKVIARITVPSRPTQPMVRVATVLDAWIKVDGVWYRRVDQPSLPPSAK